MPLDDLVLTIDSEDEESLVGQKLPATKTRKAGSKSKVSREPEVGGLEDRDTLNPEFTFDAGGDIYDEILDGKDALGDLVKGSKRVCLTPSCTN